MTPSLPTEPPKFTFFVQLMTDLPTVGTVGVVLILHAMCSYMADSKFILMHDNCSRVCLEDVWAVLGHYSSTMWSGAATRAADTMLVPPKNGGNQSTRRIWYHLQKNSPVPSHCMIHPASVLWDV